VRLLNTPSPLMMRAVGLAVAALLLVSCGETGGAERPTASSTRTPNALPSPTATLPNPTRSPEREDSSSASEPESERVPTRTPERPEASSPAQTEPEDTKSSEREETSAPTQPEPEDTKSSEREETSAPTQPERTVTRTQTSTATQSAPAAVPSPTTSPSVAPTSTETDGAPSWLWWVLGALVLALAVGIPLLVRSRHRQAWRDDLASAEDEVAWFARVLIPQLRQQPSFAEVAGGWNVAETRVIAVEDRLTALEPSAPDEAAVTRVRTLRDAVRTARTDIQTLLASGQPGATPQDLDAVATHLEQALNPPNPTDGTDTLS
jgi:hypothetical protein